MLGTVVEGSVVVGTVVVVSAVEGSVVVSGDRMLPLIIRTAHLISEVSAPAQRRTSPGCTSLASICFHPFMSSS